jgi:DNA polymerase-1
LKVIIDIEANGLNPDQIWCVVCKDVDTGEVHVFKHLTLDEDEKTKFLDFTKHVSHWIGHNILDYDLPVLSDLVGYRLGLCSVTDTLIVSKLVDYSRGMGHSLEAYGLEFGYEKETFNDWNSKELRNLSSPLFKSLLSYCLRDVEINYRIYLKYLDILRDPKWTKSITLEHRFQGLVNSLSNNGFSFNTKRAKELLDIVTKELSLLDKDILKEFPPRLKLLKEITPRFTKHGTLNKADFRFVSNGDLSIYNGGPFCRLQEVEFNPASHKQIIEVLNSAGWSPTDKTQTHVETEREVQRLKYNNRRTPELDLALQSAIVKLDALRKDGWKVNENNLSTLPDSAPAPARTLAKRILLESRRRTLTEWLGLVNPDTNRIHGTFYGIGAWTHRMAHQKPNTANIPSEFKEDGSPKLLGREMRQLWQAPRNRLLVGVDAEGIQLRIFAHYIDDPEFTHALVEGRKSDKTDPHSLNQRVIGSLCKTRQAAKRFIYALLLGAGLDKLAQILDCSRAEAEEALNRLLNRYEGFARLRQTRIAEDARLGYFIGLDGRKVPLPGGTLGTRKHLCMSGYLQNGEAIVMKMAAIKWHEQLDQAIKAEEWAKRLRYLFVNMVHDEWQTEVNNDMTLAIKVAEIQANSLKEVGEELNLKCPLAGSYWNDDHEEYTIGTNWYQTH